MPKYSFVAKSLKGETKTGTAEAPSVSQLAENLRKEGFFLVKAELEEKKERKKFRFSLPSFRVPLTEKIFFTRNLQVMVASGMPLTRALSSLSQQVKNRRFRIALEKITEMIVRGSKLSDALLNYPDIFSEFYQNMIKVAEEAGNLEEVLGTLASHLERENEIKSKIKGAMVYPIVVISAMILIGILMLILVVPNLSKTFEELEVELPTTTKIVITLGNFLAKKWYFLFLGIIFFLFLFSRFYRLKVGKKIVGTILLKMPIFSDLIKKSNSASTARGLSSLLSAGVSLPRAIEITANTLDNIFYKEALMESVEKVKKGEKLSVCLKPYQKIYPLTLISMIEVGEETGETSSVLEKLAQFYEDEVSNAAKNLASAIEPILLLIVGGVVGFFAVSMVQPMYSMLEAIK